MKGLVSGSLAVNLDQNIKRYGDLLEPSVNNFLYERTNPEIAGKPTDLIYDRSATQLASPQTKTAKAFLNQSVDIYRSNFVIGERKNTRCMSIEDDRSNNSRCDGKRSRSPWIRDPFKSQIQLI